MMPTALAAPVLIDVILIVTSFATELARPDVTDERTLRTPYRVLYIKIFSRFGHRIFITSNQIWFSIEVMKIL